MTLPQIVTPEYEVKILSKDKPIKYRPFLVREQKIMMMAVEAKDIQSTVTAVKQIIKNCVLEKNFNVDDLPLVDIETLFINLRARSMGEILNTYFKCTNMISEDQHVMMTPKQCGMIIEVPVNLLTDVKLSNEPLPNKIMLTQDVGVLMKYPSLELVNKLLESNNETMIFTLVSSCIDKIFDKDSVYKAKDATQEEMNSFVENLPTESFKLLDEFIDKIPKSKVEMEKKCSKCGFQHKFVLEGLGDFFL